MATPRTRDRRKILRGGDAVARGAFYSTRSSPRNPVVSRLLQGTKIIGVGRDRGDAGVDDGWPSGQAGERSIEDHSRIVRGRRGLGYSPGRERTCAASTGQGGFASGFAGLASCSASADGPVMPSERGQGERSRAARPAILAFAALDDRVPPGLTPPRCAAIDRAPPCRSAPTSPTIFVASGPMAFARAWPPATVARSSRPAVAAVASGSPSKSAANRGR